MLQALTFLGQNEKLGLTGRPNRPLGIIGTSKIYRLLGRTVICYPLQFDLMDFYMYQDINFLVDDIKVRIKVCLVLARVLEGDTTFAPATIAPV